jgi:hypothetical protein
MADRAPRGRLEEPWERGLYVLLLIVAVVVILYSLFGIATLLGYLPVSQSGGGAKQVQHPAMGALPSRDRITDRGTLATTDGNFPCVRRARVKVAALTRSSMSSTFAEQAGAECAEVESDRLAARNPAGAIRSPAR